MKKATKPVRAKTPMISKKPLAKLAKPKKPLASPKQPQGRAALAETVAQLSRTTDKLERAADKLAEAATRLAAATEARYLSAELPSRAISDPMPRQEPEASASAAQPE